MGLGRQERLRHLQPEGDYTALIETTDQVGNKTTSSLPITLDITAPTINNYTATNPNFSPNNDSQKDTTTLTATTTDRHSSPITYTLTIEQDTNTIKTWTGTGNPNHTWDGKNDAGQIQPDHNYTAELTATDSAGNDTASVVQLVIDTNGPAIGSLAITDDVITPDADSIRDTTTVSGTLSDPTQPITWVVNVRNSSSTTVRTASGTGALSFTWDGKNASGQVQGEGMYTFEIKATDGAGATRTDTSLQVRVDNFGPVIAGFDATAQSFSPNDDGSQDTTTITAGLSDPSMPISWTLEVRSGANFVLTASGSGDVQWLWNGDDGAEDRLQDGSYSILLTATDAVERVRTASISITIDTRAPGVQTLQSYPNPFSPDETSPRRVASHEDPTTCFSRSFGHALRWTGP